MKMSILDARVIDPYSGLDQVTNLHLKDGKIIAIGTAPICFSASETIDANGLVAAPGLVDLNVTLRDAGYRGKGNLTRETRAAASGGVTSLCCPPRAPSLRGATRCGTALGPTPVVRSDSPLRAPAPARCWDGQTRPGPSS